MATANLRRGYVLGLTAYVIWGLFPLYFKLLERIPAVEIIVQRAVWSALFGAVLLLFWKHPGWWRELRQNPQRFVVLAASGLLIASNWMTYVWAVNNGHMLEASLGYYINPLINVMLGMLLLKERLRPLQWLAVALASLGVAQQVWQLGSLPWVSLVLALTFGFYGLIRKKAPVAALPGLVVETWLLLPLALVWLLFFADGPTSETAFWSTPEALWVVAAGPVTLVPLVCFNAAARHLPYATLGFLQYLAPTLVLLQAILLFGEHPREIADALDAQVLGLFLGHGQGIGVVEAGRLQPDQALGFVELLDPAVGSRGVELLVDVVVDDQRRAGVLPDYIQLAAFLGGAGQGAAQAGGDRHVVAALLQELRGDGGEDALLGEGLAADAQGFRLRQAGGEQAGAGQAE